MFYSQYHDLFLDLAVHCSGFVAPPKPPHPPPSVESGVSRVACMNCGSTAAPAARISGGNQELTVKDKRHKGLPQRGSVISTHVWVGGWGGGCADNAGVRQRAWAWAALLMVPCLKKNENGAHLPGGVSHLSDGVRKYRGFLKKKKKKNLQSS